MAWDTPITNWTNSDFFNLELDFNRIEGNTRYIYDFYKNVCPPITLQSTRTWNVNDIPTVQDVERITDNVNSISTWCLNPDKTKKFSNISPMTTLAYQKLNELEKRISDISVHLQNTALPNALWDKNMTAVNDNSGQQIYMNNKIPGRINYDSRYSTAEIDQFITNVK